MPNITIVKDIDATAEKVFDCVAHIENYRLVQPAITEIKFLTEQKTGVGTKFAETRVMKGRESTVELEVTEYEAPSRVRIVSDAHGTVWDSVFTVVPLDGRRSRLTLSMDARAYRWLPKLLNPFLMRLISGYIEDDMERVKSACEDAVDSVG